MDPYLSIEHSLTGKKFKTDVKEEGGKNAIWNQSFDIEIYSLEDELKIKCLDQDIGRDDIVGETTVTVDDIISLSNEDCVTLYHEMQKGADIFMKAKLTLTNKETNKSQL